MFANVFTLHRLKSSGPYMQRQLTAGYSYLAHEQLVDVVGGG